MLVAKQPARGRVARDVDVGPAVVVVVGGHGRHRIGAAGGGDAGLAADIRERAVAIVAKQLNEPGRQAARTAVHRHALPAAVGVLSRLRQFLERGVEVIGDEQIEVTVAIEVHPRAPGPVSHRVLAQAGLGGHVAERPVAVVAIQHVVAVVGDEQIVEPVVVVVADGDRRGPAGARQAGLVRHIRERAVAIVLVEAIGRLRPALPRDGCRSARRDRASRRCRSRGTPLRSPPLRRCSSCGRRRHRRSGGSAPPAPRHR